MPGAAGQARGIWLVVVTRCRFLIFFGHALLLLCFVLKFRLGNDSRMLICHSRRVRFIVEQIGEVHALGVH